MNWFDVILILVPLIAILHAIERRNDREADHYDHYDRIPGVHSDADLRVYRDMMAEQEMLGRLLGKK